MTRTPARVFNIPASAPFLPVLVRALLDGKLVAGIGGSSDAGALADATIYLPTRRACSLLRDIFLDVSGTRAAILPRIVAIGDIDEDELIFADAAGPLSPQAFDLPPALPTLERQLLLSRLILEWSKTAAMRGVDGAPLVAGSAASAFALAGDLARLIDDMTTRQVDWAKLDTLIPDEFDRYWQMSLEFLKIARHAWPALLAEAGTIEPAARRDRMIEAEAARIGRSKGPVIAAGSTGSMPATAKLLAAVARLPHGAVVLPGLDMTLDDESWNAIAGDTDSRAHDRAPAANHPQFAMSALLAQIGITRAEVTALAPCHARDVLLSEALRPASTTDLWQQRKSADEFRRGVDEAIQGVVAIEAPGIEDEALAIAVALRGALETPRKTAALVTPDRALARRVAAALKRWNIDVSDSAGEPLSVTAAGTFARLSADAALSGLEPVPLLALLKHPHFQLGDPGRKARAVSALERAVFRAPRPNAGSASLVAALAAFRTELEKSHNGESSALHRSDPRAAIALDALDDAQALAADLGAALEPLERAPASLPLSAWAARHRQVVASISDDMSGNSDADALDRLFNDLIDSGAAGEIPVARSDYVELLAALLSGGSVRPPAAPSSRIQIYGPLEARLQNADRMVLGGLNEAAWPPDIRTDPWLSRPMRQRIGLDLPERRIGLAAHDFVQSFGASEIFLTRSTKVAGAPTVMSRFVQRIAALAGDHRWKAANAAGTKYLEWAHALDAPAIVSPAQQPRPDPPLDARPKRLSVTEIEHWLRDPYTIYAKHILGLQPFDPVDASPGAAERGTFIHAAIGEYTERFAATLPANPLRELLALGEKHFAPHASFAQARALWWPRFARIAQTFVAWDTARRAAIASIHAEIKGAIDIPVRAGTFTLTARADRIERLNDGRYVILDYKTGQAPSSPQVKSGLSPQLTLEAAMLRNGGFKDVPAAPKPQPPSVAELVYVALRTDAADIGNPINFRDSTPDAAADHALSKLALLVRRFLDDGEPYRSMVSPMWKNRYGDYDHLARVKEWSAAGETDGGGE